MSVFSHHIKGAAPERAIVLSGGGARGAYEAGVLSYLFNELPRPLVEKANIRILCGTSVGAIHVAFLAANAHVPHRNIGRLIHVWRSLQLEEMLRLDALDLVRLPFDLRRMLKSEIMPKGVLVHSARLFKTVTEEIDWAMIAENLNRGTISAVTVTATHPQSGRSVVFVDTRDGVTPTWTRDIRTIPKATRLGPKHTLASAAIPFLFPAVKIDGVYYCDGGLRQNTPLSPALRLGADKVLVVSLRHEEQGQPRLYSEEGEPYPGPLLMLGKILDALMLDHLDYDIARLEGFNGLLADGRRAFGGRFFDEMGTSARRIRGAPYREIHPTVVRPSRDIGEMATEFIHIHRKRLQGVGGWLLSKVAASDFLTQSDLLSYFLFDGRFAEALIELGRSDADSVREQLLEYLRSDSSTH